MKKVQLSKAVKLIGSLIGITIFGVIYGEIYPQVARCDTEQIPAIYMGLTFLLWLPFVTLVYISILSLVKWQNLFRKFVTEMFNIAIVMIAIFLISLLLIANQNY